MITWRGTGLVAFCLVIFIVMLQLWRCRGFDMDAYKKFVQGDIATIDQAACLFAQSPKELVARADFACEQARSTLDAIVTADDTARTFENTIKAYDHADRLFSTVAHAASILEVIHPDAALRSTAHDVSLRLQRFAVDAFLAPALYHACRTYATRGKDLHALSPEQRYFLEEQLKSFERAGLGLPDDKLAMVKELQKKIADKELAYDAALAADQSCVRAPESGLDGVAAHFKQSLDRDGGDYVLRCDTPTVNQILGYCTVEKTRRDLYRSYNQRAYPGNADLLKEILTLRHELAALIGYPSYAHLSLDSEMVETPERAQSFLEELLANVSHKRAAEIAAWISTAGDAIVAPDGQLQPWDVRFVQEKYKKEHFAIDERQLAEYFSMDTTINGIFAIYQELLGLRFALDTPRGVWHESVKVMQVFDAQTNQLLGFIFLDLHPRPFKYSHACHAGISPATWDIVNGVRKQRPSVALLIANFPKPTPEQPSLLLHSDVTTFFHEFGHAMHYVLGRTEMAGFAGTAVKRDFVEMPSQMFEEWMWNTDMLKRVSKHYKTGETLPDVIVDRMVELKRFDSGYWVSRQLNFSLVSLLLHGTSPISDIDTFVQRVHQQCLPGVCWDAENRYYASFGHLMGYAARYYGYLWSKVFAIDLFDYVRARGLLDHTVGRRLAEQILGVGGSLQPDVMLQTFLGRAPTTDAFFKELGIKQA